MMTNWEEQKKACSLPTRPTRSPPLHKSGTDREGRNTSYGDQMWTRIKISREFPPPSVTLHPWHTHGTHQIFRRTYWMAFSDGT
ncbi:hypothetical protein BaRGS_00029028 [Batillaria attramentaria]|uniref:Uncharacterized protein n=1 Tax=Batillaria attramentaria TaxID=370345 RepID=A0ABD0JXI7_9CAEN